MLSMMLFQLFLASEDAHPHPGAMVPWSCSCCPQLHCQFSVLNSSGLKQWFLCSVPGRGFLSNDNPWDTDCLILPEPNCGRDKERVKDIPSCLSLLGNKRSCCSTLPLPKGARARLRMHGVEVGTGQRHMYHSPRAHPSLPCTQTSQDAQVFPTLYSLPQLPSCHRDVTPADMHTLAGSHQTGVTLTRGRGWVQPPPQDQNSG